MDFRLIPYNSYPNNETRILVDYMDEHNSYPEETQIRASFVDLLRKCDPFLRNVIRNFLNRIDWNFVDSYRKYRRNDEGIS